MTAWQKSLLEITYRALTMIVRELKRILDEYKT